MRAEQAARARGCSVFYHLCNLRMKRSQSQMANEPGPSWPRSKEGPRAPLRPCCPEQMGRVTAQTCCAGYVLRTGAGQAETVNRWTAVCVTKGRPAPGAQDTVWLMTQLPKLSSGLCLPNFPENSVAGEARLVPRPCPLQRARKCCLLQQSGLVLLLMCMVKRKSCNIKENTRR